MRVIILLLLLFSFSCNQKTISSKSVQKQQTEIKKENEYLFDVLGVYSTKKDSLGGDCELKITISKKSNDLKYKFQSTERTLEGNVSLELDESKQGYYITFEGIQWSENEGAIDTDDDAEEKEPLELPIGINGSFYDKEISIQNSGNSMNYYVQLSDCGSKFIHLYKE